MLWYTKLVIIPAFIFKILSSFPGLKSYRGLCRILEWKCGGLMVGVFDSRLSGLCSSPGQDRSIILNPLPFLFPTVSFPFPSLPFSSPTCPFFPLIFHHLLFPSSYLQIPSSPTAILAFISSPFSFFLSRCLSFPFPSHSIPFYPVTSLFFSLPSFLFTSVPYPFSTFRSYPSPPLLFLSVPFSLVFL